MLTVVLIIVSVAAAAFAALSAVLYCRLGKEKKRLEMELASLNERLERTERESASAAEELGERLLSTEAELETVGGMLECTEDSLQSVRDELERSEALVRELRSTDPVTGLLLPESFYAEANSFIKESADGEDTVAVYVRAEGAYDSPAEKSEELLRLIGITLKDGGARLFTRCAHGEFFGLVRVPAGFAASVLGELTADLSERARASAGYAVRENEGLLALREAARRAAYSLSMDGREGILCADDAEERTKPLSNPDGALQALLKPGGTELIFSPVISSSNAKIIGYKVEASPLALYPSDMAEALRLQRLLGRDELSRHFIKTALERISRLIEGGQLLYNTHFWLCLPDSEVKPTLLYEFAEEYYDILKNTVLEPVREESIERTSSVLATLECMGIASAVRADSASELKLLLLHGSEYLLRVDAAVAQCSPSEVTGAAKAAGLTVFADGITTAEELNAAVKAGADTVGGPYFSRGELLQTSLSDKQLKELGEAKFGKRGRTL